MYIFLYPHILFLISLKSNHSSGNSNLGKSAIHTHTHTYILLGLIFSICTEFIFLLIVFLQLILRSVCIPFNIYHNGKKDAHPYSKWRTILLFLCLSQSTKWTFHRWIKWSWSYVIDHKDCILPLIIQNKKEKNGLRFLHKRFRCKRTNRIFFFSLMCSRDTWKALYISSFWVENFTLSTGIHGC